MTPQEHILKMTIAIRQAIKVMGDRFGSTEQDVVRAIEELKKSILASSDPSLSVPIVPTTNQPVSAEQGNDYRT